MPAKLTEDQKQALKTFREQHSANAEPLKKYVADLRRDRKQVTDALRKAPATVPELVQQTGLPADQVLWHVTAMRKYGTASEVGPDGDYVKYALVEQNGK
jgi:predicted Rossmann fold nucleotide-binding protein DprA/Smf involved in DNA uptake